MCHNMPMVSRNSFSMPLKCIGTTSCLQTAKYKCPDIIFKKTICCNKIVSHSFCGAVLIPSGAVSVFPAPSPCCVRPSYGNFFLMVFLGNCMQGCTAQMIKVLISLAKPEAEKAISPPSVPTQPTSPHPTEDT